MLTKTRESENRLENQQHLTILWQFETTSVLTRHSRRVLPQQGPSDGQRGPLLTVLGPLSRRLAEDVPQDLGHRVDAELAPNGQGAEQLQRARFPQQRLEGERRAGPVLGG